MTPRICQSLREDVRLRRFWRSQAGAFAFLSVLAACSDSTGPNRVVTITPIDQTVALQSSPAGKILRTSVTLTNNSRSPVTWDKCAWTLEKKLGITALATDGPTFPWVTVSGGPICYLAIAYLPLQPGQSVQIPIEVTVGTSQFDGSPGEYRVHLVLGTTVLENQWRPIPHDLSVSDAFTVVSQ